MKLQMKHMKHLYKFLVDPITARRFLPKGYIWVGNNNNVEDFVLLDTFDINYRDLKARFLLLKQKVDYVLNSRLLLPTSNKYISQAQALDKLPPCILKHNNGIVKQAISGIDYVDYSSFSNGKLCVIHPEVSEISNKLISVSDITPLEIHNHFEEYNEYKTEVTNNFETIKQNITEINNSITNITNEVTNVNQTINNHTTEITNITNEITNVNNNITNLEQHIENNIQNIQEQIQNIDNSVTNITNEINNEINVNLGDINLQLQAQLEMINNLIAQVNSLVTAIANINALIVVLQARMDSLEAGNCIAWALGNDMLTIEYEDNV